MIKSRFVSIPVAKSSANGGGDFTATDWTGSKNSLDRVGPGLFPPAVVVAVKALACELPCQHGSPLARWSVSELAAQVRRSGLVATISDSTVWRWLHEDAIQPWRYRGWIFPRDPQFAVKAGRILDLYEGQWEGKSLQDGDFVVSADEKTSIQARWRIHRGRATQPGYARKVEHEYERRGALCYLAAWDVRRAKLFGRCEGHSGIAAFDRLVDGVMRRSPYRQARRVFWIMDNGSSHRGERCVQRLRRRYRNVVVVHGPVHASWLNQIEIYFSILQRKVLTPNECESVESLQRQIGEFERYYETIATPFEWKFTRKDLESLLRRRQPHKEIALPLGA